MEELKIIAHQWFDKANKLRFLQANKFNIADTCKSINEASLWRKNSFPIKPNPLALTKLVILLCKIELRHYLLLWKR
jgi:hypothetical protein